MKRNWLTYVSLAAALIAGMICSTAFADGKKGGKFSGGSVRNFSGGSIGSSSGGNAQMNSSRNLAPRTLGNSSGQSGNLQLQNQGLKKLQVQPGNQIRSLQGNANGNQLGQLNPGQLNKAKLPQVGGSMQISPDSLKKLNPAIIGNNSPVKINPNVVKQLNPAIVGNKPTINLNPDLIKKVNPAIIGGKFCVPICPPKPCDPCFNPCNSWCGPCWWWSPCWDPCHHSCFFPTFYCHPDPIVVTVPVYTTVIAAGAVGGQAAPAVAVEPVEEKLMQITVGATVTLQGKDLGDKPGMLVVQIDKVSLPAQVNEWKPDSANVTLPMLGLAGPTKAQLWMVKADGAVAANMAVELLPVQQPAAGAVATK